MPKRQLTLQNIARLDDGRIAKAFEMELEHIVRDCNDRNTLKKPRVVALVFRVVPQVQPSIDGRMPEGCDEAIVDCKIHSNIPKRESKSYTMAVKQSGALVFDDVNPADGNQPGVFDDAIDPVTGELKEAK